MKSPFGRSAPAAAASTPSRSPKYTSVSADTIKSKACAVVAQVLRQLGLRQLVVDALFFRVSQHSAGEVDAHQSARIRRDERAAEPRATAGVQHLEALRRLETRILQHGRHERRGAVRQPLELGFEGGGEAVEGPLDESVRRARRHISTGAGRHHVQRNRILGLFLEPLVEDLHGLADLAQRAVRQRQQLSRFPVLRPERDHLAVARRRFLGSFQPVEQDAQVGVGVDVIRMQSNGGAIGGFRCGRVLRSPSTARRDCCARSRGPGRWRSPAGRRRSRAQPCRSPGR